MNCNTNQHAPVSPSRRCLAGSSCKSGRQSCNSALRSGISLLEVLMAIFVISVGLLGLAALLPLAQHLANRGATADRAAIAGRAALHQARVRGILNPDNWLDATGNPITLTTAPTTPPDTTLPLQPGGPKAYCIDPRLLSRDASATTFPNTGVSMPRVTLRRWTGGAAKAGTALSIQQADEWFTIRDDLNFTVDDSNSAVPATQVLDAGQKRFSDDDFSWLATLVREVEGDTYTLSVAVINKRHNPLKTNELPLGITFLGTGVGGGDVTLASTNIDTLKAAVPGQWILLHQQDASDPMNPKRRFRWYRIAYAADINTTVSPAQREVTLAGRDWDTVAPFNLPNGTLIPGVIAVYERTVRLETSSLWER